MPETIAWPARRGAPDPRRGNHNMFALYDETFPWPERLNIHTLSSKGWNTSPWGSKQKPRYITLDGRRIKSSLSLGPKSKGEGWKNEENGKPSVLQLNQVLEIEACIFCVRTYGFLVKSCKRYFPERLQGLSYHKWTGGKEVSNVVVYKEDI